MKYAFKLFIKDGIEIISEIETDLNLVGCPFGYTSFGMRGSSEVDQPTLESFWKIIEDICVLNDVQIENFDRVVSATDEEGNVYGEGSLNFYEITESFDTSAEHMPPQEHLP